MQFTTMFYVYLKSYFRSKRFLVIFPIYILLSSLSIILYFAGVVPKPSDVYSYTSEALTNFVFATSLAAGVFAGDAISRDFSREGFFTLTQPISRARIFVSRLLAALAVCVIVIFSDFYLVGISFGYYLFGQVIPNIYILIGLGLFFVFGVVSFALLFSSIFKSQLVSGIVTTLVLWFVMPTISGILQFVNIEPWFLLNYAGSAVQAVAKNTYPPHYQEIVVPNGTSKITLHLYNPTVPEAVAIIAFYSIISIIAGIIIYKRRELKEI